MAGLEDLSLGKAASELEGLASVLKPRKPTIGGLYLPEDPPVQKKEKSILKEGTDAFINSLGPQNVRLMGAGLRALGTTIQNEEVHGLGYKVERYGEEMDIGAPPTLPKIKDFESALRWMSGGLGSGLGSTALPIAAGISGGMLGQAAGGPLAGLVAGTTSAFAVSDVIMTGEAVTQFEQSGVDPLVASEAAASIGPLMASLDTLGLLKIFRGPVRGDKALLNYIGQRIAHGASIESVTEMAQGVIRELTDAHLSGDPKLAERASAILEEGAIAAMVGGVLGGGAASLSRRRREQVEPDQVPEETPTQEPMVDDPESVEPDRPTDALQPEQPIEDVPEPTIDRVPEPAEPAPAEPVLDVPETVPETPSAPVPDEPVAEPEEPKKPPKKKPVKPDVVPEVVPETVPDTPTPPEPVEPEPAPGPEQQPEPEPVDETKPFTREEFEAYRDEPDQIAETGRPHPLRQDGLERFHEGVLNIRDDGEVIWDPSRSLIGIKANIEHKKRMWRSQGWLEEDSDKVTPLGKRIWDYLDNQPFEPLQWDQTVRGGKITFGNFDPQEPLHIVRQKQKYAKTFREITDISTRTYGGVKKQADATKPEFWDDVIARLNEAHDRVVQAGGEISEGSLVGYLGIHGGEPIIAKGREAAHKRFINAMNRRDPESAQIVKDMLEGVVHGKPMIRLRQDSGKSDGFAISGRSFVQIGSRIDGDTTESVLAHELGHFIFAELMSHKDKAAFLQAAKDYYTDPNTDIRNVEILKTDNLNTNTMHDIHEMFAYNFQKWMFTQQPQMGKIDYWKRVVSRYIKAMYDWLTGKRTTVFDPIFNKYFQLSPDAQARADKARQPAPTTEPAPDTAPEPKTEPQTPRAPPRKPAIDISDEGKADRDKLRQRFANDDPVLDDENILFSKTDVNAQPERLDAEIMTAGVNLSQEFVNKGNKDFVSYAQFMIGEVGGGIRPYLKMFYSMIRNMPGQDTEGMNSDQEIEEIYQQNEEARRRALERQNAGNEPRDDGGRAPKDDPGTEPGIPGESDPDGGPTGGGRDTGVRGGERDGITEPTEEPRDEQDQPQRDEGTSDGTTDGLPGETDTDRGPDSGGQGVLQQPVRRNVRYFGQPEALNEGRNEATKATDNLEAIELLKRLKGEGRGANPEEQKVLSKYVGWGGIKGAFPNPQGKYKTPRLEQIGKRLKQVLTQQEYDAARRTIQYAHYTPQNVIEAMWTLAEKFGLKEGAKIFEPGAGVGHFAGFIPDNLLAGTTYDGIEYDPISAQISEQLFPEYNIKKGDFIDTKRVKNKYDFVIGNPPFSDLPVDLDGKKYMLHDYFFLRSLESLKPGGLMIFVTSSGTLNKRNSKAREKMAESADFVTGIRLPGGRIGAFNRAANTQVTTDIIVMRKRKKGETKTPGLNVPQEKFIDAEMVPYPTDLTNSAGNREWVDVPVSKFFNEEPGSQRVIGSPAANDPRNQGRYIVRWGGSYGEYVERLNEVVNQTPSLDIYSPDISAKPETLPDTIETNEVKAGTIFEKGNEFYRSDGEQGIKITVAEKNKPILRGMIRIRDNLRDVIAANVANNNETGDAARAKLNKEYDQFVKNNGPLTKSEKSAGVISMAYREQLWDDARKFALDSLEEFDYGTFIPSASFYDKSLTERFKERDALRKAYAERGEPFDEGGFNQMEVPPPIKTVYPNLDLMVGDPERYRLQALENAETKAKERIFFENTNQIVEQEINDVFDAMNTVMADAGQFDLDKIVEAYGKPREEVIAELGNRIFELPSSPGEYEESSAYLSGDVKTKLESAKEAAEADSRFQRNVEELEKVVPEDLLPSEIDIRLGARWIGPEELSDFVFDFTDGSLKYNPTTRKYSIQGEGRAFMANYSYDPQVVVAGESTAMTQPVTAKEILLAVMNGSPLPKGKYRIDGKEVTHDAATQQIELIGSRMRREFDVWMESNPYWTARVAKIYNERFRRVAPRVFDGSYLTTPGLNKEFKLRDIQKNVIARIIQTGNTYMAHAVGSGKTASMIVSAMEMRRLGLARKPMIAVPKSVVAQFATEANHLYPTANIRIIDTDEVSKIGGKDSKDRQQKLLGDIGVRSDIDLIIVSHTFLSDNIPVSAEFESKILEERIQNMRDVLAASKDGAYFTAAQIEKRLEKMMRDYAKLQQRINDGSEVFTFEETGVDFLFVDEAQAFRKPGIETVRSIKGVDSTPSKRAMDLYTKARLLREQGAHGGGLVLASGTPIVNTMGELYSIQKYLQQDTLEQEGITTFDEWADLFGRTKVQFEADAGGTFKYVERFSQFVNKDELVTMAKEVFDLVQQDELDQHVVLPKLITGQRQMMVGPQTPLEKALQAQLKKRLESLKPGQQKEKKEEGPEDNHLVIINDGRKAAIDMRLINPDFENDPNSKLNRMIRNVFDVYEKTKKQEFHTIDKEKNQYGKVVETGPATQILFTSLGMTGPFKIQDWIRSELTRMGVNPEEIAFINDYNDNYKKANLFREMNQGKVRILIGHPETLGTGVNVQNRLFAIHNLDPLWLPGLDTQRVGREIRQGNMNPEVHVFDYSVDAGFDFPMWGLMKTKQGFITDFWKSSNRTIDEVQGDDYYALIEAASSGDPRYRQLGDMKKRITELKNERIIAERRTQSLATAESDLERSIEVAERDAKNAERIAETATDVSGTNISFHYTYGDNDRVIEGNTQDTLDSKGKVKKKADRTKTADGKNVRKEIDAAIKQAVRLMQRVMSERNARATTKKVGEIGGLNLLVDMDVHTLRTKKTYTLMLNDKDSTNGAIEWVVSNDVDLAASISSQIKGLGKVAEFKKKSVTDKKAELEKVKQRMKEDKGFQGQEEFRTLFDQIEELEQDLRADTEAQNRRLEAVPTIQRRDPDFVDRLQEQAEEYVTPEENAVKMRYTFLRQEPTGKQGMSLENIRGMVDNLTRDWDPNTVPGVRVVATAAQLPTNIALQATQDYGGVSGIRSVAATVDGYPHVFVVADQMQNNRQIKEAIAHELVKHVSVEEMLGNQFGDVIAQIYQDRNLPKYQSHTEKVISADPAIPPDEFAMKMIESMAADKTINPAMVKSMNLVRKYLRGLGLNVDYSSEVVMDYLTRANKQLKKPGLNPKTDAISAYNYDGLPSIGQRHTAMKYAMSQTRIQDIDGNEIPILNYSKKDVRPQKPPVIQLTRPVESVFRSLTLLPFLGTNEQGNLRLTEGMIKNGRKFVREVRPRKGSQFAWMDPFIETARHGWLNRYQTDPEFVKRERARFTQEHMILQDMIGHVEMMREMNMTQAEAKQLNEMLTKGTPMNDKALQNLGENVRAAIDSLGAQMVEAGLLSEETWQRNLGEYMHRSYAKYEFKDSAGVGSWVRSIRKRRTQKIVGDELKRQGLAHYFPGFDRLLKDIHPDHRDAAMKVKKWRVMDRLSQDGSKVLKRVYIPAGKDAFVNSDVDTKNPNQNWVDQGEWEIRTEYKASRRGPPKPVRPYLWRQYTEEEFDQNTLIRDARFNIVKTYKLMAHDLSTGKFFNDIAQNPAWFQEKVEPDSTVLEFGAEKLNWTAAAYAKYDWVKVPETNIPKSAVKEWHSLAGGYVKGWLWRDLNELNKMQKRTYWTAFLSMFKESKTVLSPNVHFNNFMGNAILSELYDFDFTDIKDGFLEMARKGDLYQEALKNGVFAGGYVQVELDRLDESKTIEKMIREVEQEFADGQNVTNMMKTTKLMLKLGDALQSVRKGMQDAYRWEDEVFRMVSYMHDRSRGVSEEDAVQNSLDRFLNYDIRAPWPNALRRTILPFFSYTYAFIPQMIKAVVSKPWKVAKMYTIAYALEALSEAVLGGDADEERKLMRPIDQGHTWAGLPTMLRLPIADQRGNPMYLGMRRLLPGGGIMETDNNILGVYEWMAIGGPIQIAGEVAWNRSQFTGQDIVNDMVDTGTEKAAKRMEYIWRALVPNLGFLPGTWNYENLTRAFGNDVDMFGRQYDVPTAMIRQFGPKLYPFDKTGQRAMRVMEYQRELQALNADLMQKSRLYARNRMNKAEFEKYTAKTQEKIERVSKKLADL